MYRATNENQAFVASKTVSIKPESQIDYKPGGEIRWLIPQYLGFVNPEKTFLKFDFQLTGNGKHWAGSALLFRHRLCHTI